MQGMAHESPDWLDLWVDRYGDRLVKYAFVITRDYHLAQDVTQETFLRLYQFRARSPERDVVPGWLFTTLRRLALTALKRRHHWVGLEGHHTAVPDTAVWLPAAFQDMMQHLSVADRECIWLFYYNDWTTDAIARHLGQSPGAVRGRLMRARRRLRALWEGD